MSVILAIVAQVIVALSVVGLERELIPFWAFLVIWVFGWALYRFSFNAPALPF